jgi:N-acyl-D-amino-acid deacylase
MLPALATASHVESRHGDAILMDDLVIRGGGILDGTGTDAVQGDLAIRDGRIVAITSHYAGTARREIDTRGLIVAPGFIDIKTHSDFTLPYAPGAESKGLQGVTTEVIGHCGFSLAPVLPGRAPILREYPLAIDASAITFAPESS